MRLARVALVTGLLVRGSAGAADAGPAPSVAIRQAMSEAMMNQAAMPMRSPMMPGMRTAGSAPASVRPPPGRIGSDEGQRTAARTGMQDAAAIRAEMANHAARGCATGAMTQTHGDMMNAPMMQRSIGMDPGGGMMPSGGSGGGGMGPGGMGPGGTGGGAMGSSATSATGTPGAMQPSGGGR